jgi:hypothetical protein
MNVNINDFLEELYTASHISNELEYVLKCFYSQYK